MTAASLADADLRGAKLDDSELIATDLGGADLRDASLRGCDFGMAVLTGAELAGADLAQAQFDRTVLTDLDLSRTKGLRRARHEGASSLGTDTIERTLAGAAGDVKRLQEVIFFFRGAGLPDHLIEHYRRTDTSPRYRPALMLHDREDAGFCRTLQEELLARGVSCWRFPKTSFGLFTPTLERKWRGRERVIFCASRAALASEWAPPELAVASVAIARQGRDDLIVVDLDGCLGNGAAGPCAEPVRGLVAADLSRVVSGEGELEEAVERVLERLRAAP